MRRSPVVSAALIVLLSCSGSGGAFADDRSAGRHLDDSTIALSAKAALVRRDGVHSNRINVEVAKGVLLLAGFVRSEIERDEALKAVRYVDGVERTIDGMVVQAGKRSAGEVLDDTAIQTRLKTRLASMEGAGKAVVINIDVRKGAVLMSGFLSDQKVIDDAGEIARGVPGVGEVHNKLALLP